MRRTKSKPIDACAQLLCGLLNAGFTAIRRFFTITAKRAGPFPATALVTIAKFSAFPSIFSNLHSFYSNSPGPSFSTCPLIPIKLITCLQAFSIAPLYCAYPCQIVSDLCVVRMQVLGHHLDNNSTPSRWSRSTLPRAWHDVTGSLSGTDNSPNSVNMSLGQAVGQVQVTS